MVREASMRRITMNCQCCRLAVMNQGEGVYTVIEYNGATYMGWQRFARAMGLTKAAITGRASRGHCLRETKGVKRRALAEVEISKLMNRWARVR